MGLVQDQQVYLLHLDIAMEKEVVELLRDEDKDIVVAELLQPVFVFIDLFVVFPA
jgi:hypothetical protein